MNTKGFTPIYILIIIISVCIIATVVVYFSSKPRNNNISPISIPASSVNKPIEAVVPKESNQEGVLAKTTISYTQNENEPYIKINMNLFSSKAQHTGPNSSNDITTVYTQDDNKSYEPVEVKNVDFSKFTWSEIISQTVEDIPDIPAIYITDRVFSFRKIPDSDNSLLVLDWARNNNTTNHTFDRNERILYLYDPKNQSLREIEKFEPSKNKYSYPKIGSFSPDDKFVSLYLFGCWNCGGHQPETLLLDLTSFKTKNIGKVIEFSWVENGVYNYKDYVVVECKEPQPGECRKDPAELPLKSDHF